MSKAVADLVFADDSTPAEEEHENEEQVHDDFDIDTAGLGRVETYNARYIKPLDFGTSKVLLVKSAMGTGKATATKKLLKQRRRGGGLFGSSSTPMYKRVVVISPRIQFGRTVLGNLKSFGFKLYNDTSNVQQHDRIIIQYESLHLLARAAPFDLVICDEIESIFENMTSETTNKHWVKMNAALFKGLVCSPDTKTVALDADLSNKSVRYFGSVLHDRSPIALHINKCQPLPRNIALYQGCERWLDKIRDSLAAGNRLFVVTGSRRAAQTHSRCSTPRIRKRKSRSRRAGVSVQVLPLQV